MALNIVIPKRVIIVSNYCFENRTEHAAAVNQLGTRGKSEKRAS